MEAADRGCRLLVFYVEDYVWMFLRCERFSVGTYDKLIGQKIGECKVIGKINYNAYKMKSLNHVKTSDVFNVEALTSDKRDSLAIDVSDDDGAN